MILVSQCIQTLEKKCMIAIKMTQIDNRFTGGRHIDTETELFCSFGKGEKMSDTNFNYLRETIRNASSALLLTEHHIVHIC